MINNGWDLRKTEKRLISFSAGFNFLPKAQLHLYGYGSEKGGSAFLDAIDIGLNNVHFHGIVENKTILSALENATLLLHPSLEESFGVVLIEAMSYGIPVVGGIKSGAVPWVIANDQLLVDVTKNNDISNKILEIFHDEKLYENLGISCYENVLNRFSVEKVASAYLKLLQKIKYVSFFL